MSKFSFNGPTLTIEGDPLAVVGGVFRFDAVELYSDWCDWAALGDNLKYRPAFNTVGGDSLSGGVFIGKYVFLRNDLGWRFIPPNVGNIHVVVEGNFYPSNAAMPFFVPWPGVVTVFQTMVSQMTQAISTSGPPAPTASENAAAVLAAAQVTPIHANVKQVNNVRLIGAGIPTDPMRPA